MPLYVGGGGQFKMLPEALLVSGTTYPIVMNAPMVGDGVNVSVVSGLVRSAVVNGSVVAAGTLAVLAAVADISYYIVALSISALTAGDVTIEWSDGSDILRTHLAANGSHSLNPSTYPISKGTDNLGIQIRNNSAGAVTYSCSIQYLLKLSGRFS